MLILNACDQPVALGRTVQVCAALPGVNTGLVAIVTPLKGVMTGGGDHQLTVAVDVVQVPNAEPVAANFNFGK